MPHAVDLKTRVNGWFSVNGSQRFFFSAAGENLGISSCKTLWKCLIFTKQSFRMDDFKIKFFASGGKNIMMALKCIKSKLKTNRVET